MAQLTKKHAEDIAKKLAGRRDSSASNHEMVCIYVEGRLVALYGIRRGSRKDQSHDHVPRELHVSPRQAKDLACCPMSRDDYIEHLRQKGHL